MQEFEKAEKELDDARLAEEKADADSALNEAKEKKQRFKEGLDKAAADFTRFEAEKERLEEELAEWMH